MAPHRDRVFRHANMLGLRLENGLHAVLVDIGLDGTVAGFACCEVYRFHDYWEDIGFYVVSVDFGEASEALLVSAISAEATTLIALPRRNPWAPDMAVAVLSSDLEGYGFEIWRLVAGAWARSESCQPAPYGTRFLRWEAADRLVVSAGRDPREVAIPVGNGRVASDFCR